MCWRCAVIDVDTRGCNRKHLLAVTVPSLPLIPLPLAPCGKNSIVSSIHGWPEITYPWRTGHLPRRIRSYRRKIRACKSCSLGNTHSHLRHIWTMLLLNLYDDQKCYIPSAQSAPVHSPWHWQVPFMQSPWFEQSEGHSPAEEKCWVHEEGWLGHLPSWNACCSKNVKSPVTTKSIVQSWRSWPCNPRALQFSLAHCWDKKRKKYNENLCNFYPVFKYRLTVTREESAWSKL